MRTIIALLCWTSLLCAKDTAKDAEIALLKARLQEAQIFTQALDQVSRDPAVIMSRAAVIQAQATLEQSKKPRPEKPKQPAPVPEPPKPVPAAKPTENTPEDE